MDIFHVITSEIEHVLSCHWLDEFRSTRFSNSRTNSGSSTPTASAPVSRSTSPRPPLSRNSSSRSSMSSGHETKLMDTEKGGESTQYESIQTVTVPHSKQGGQLGEIETSTEKPGVDPERAEKTSDNIRYGQNISESGMGGMTTTSTGTADDKKTLEESGNSRTAQQYSAGQNVHDHNVGA